MKIRLTLIMVVFSVASQAQPAPAMDSTLFDFWVGEWNLTWKNADGKIEKGTNRIVKILANKVIQEHFSDEKNYFQGTSISVFNTRSRTWHQAWADNQGGYFDFVGSAAAGRRMFSTQVQEVGGKKKVQRMVFYDIGANAFTWDWELSEDGGTSWELKWRINYQRKEKL